MRAMEKSKNNKERIEKYINPFTDYGFKKIFGSEPNKDLLIDFLNELLKTKQKIKDLTYKKTEHLGSTEIDRKAIFDLYCENEHGEKFIVELQKIKQQFFKDRSLYYATFPIQEQAQKGDWNYELKAVYCIGILDFVFDDQDKDKLIVDEIKLISAKTGKVFNDTLTFVYVQMPNFIKSEAQLITHEDKWFYLLKNLNKFDRIPAKLQENIFKKVFKIAEIAKYTIEERQKYIDSLKYYLDLKNSIDTARNEGKSEGKLEGKLEGLFETAINGIKARIPRETIKVMTNLSDETLDKLYEQFKNE